MRGTSCRRFPLAGALAVAIIAMAEAGFVSTTEPLTGMPYFEPTADDATVVAKRQFLPECDDAVVLIGDSSCMMDFVPRQIEREAGYKTVNLGTLASLTTAGFCSLGIDTLQAGRRPRGIVLAVLPQAFGMTADRAAEFDLLGRYLTAYGKTSSVYAPGMRDRLSWFLRKHRFNRFPPEFGGDYLTFQSLLQAKAGHWQETNTYRGGHVVHSGFRVEHFSIDPICDLVARAKESGVPVYLWFSPSPRDALSATCLAGLSDFRGRLQSEIPGLRMLQAEVPVWEPHLFSTVTHLSADGAREHSTLFAETIERELIQSGSREPGG